MLPKRSIMFLLIMLVISVESFVIPDVKIEVFHPQGFRISMPNIEGMQLFAFHGNINKKIMNFEVGDYYKDVIRPVNGRWVYEDKVARIKKGATIYFWLYVMHDRLGYRRDNQVFKVTEVKTGDMPEINSALPELNQAVEPSPPICEDNQEIKNSLQICERTMIKLTPKLINLETDLEAEKNMTVLLTALLEQRPEGKRLTMKGNISRDGNPTTVVKFILEEKLGLRPTVVFAERNKDQSITFELSTVAEMLTVLQETKDKLLHSKVVSITY